jgi:hypothetical protein
LSIRQPRSIAKCIGYTGHGIVPPSIVMEAKIEELLLTPRVV